MWIACLLLSLGLAPLGEAKTRRGGWLGRLVSYHKKNFIEDLARLPVPITVTVEKAPANFVDDPGWDFDAVLRLVLLIEVLGVEPARQAVHFALAATRRHYLPFGVDTYKLFPSWSEFNVINTNNDTMDYESLNQKYRPRYLFDDDTVVYIDNPLEARLPSKRITVKKLRAVMEEEALLRRKMATTTTPPTTFSFTHKSTDPKGPGEGAESGSTAAGGPAAPGDETKADGEGGDTGAPPADGTTADGEGGDTGASPADGTTADGEGGDTGTPSEEPTTPE